LLLFWFLLPLLLLLTDPEFDEMPESSQPQFHGSGLGLATGSTLGFLKDLHHNSVAYKTLEVLAELQINTNTTPQNKRMQFSSMLLQYKT
jgi:hypothetical protein